MGSKEEGSRYEEHENRATPNTAWEGWLHTDKKSPSVKHKRVEPATEKQPCGKSFLLKAVKGGPLVR